MVKSVWSEGLLHAFIIISVTSVWGQDTCTKVDNCSCKWKNGTIVSLTALIGVNGQPRFKDVQGFLGRNKYSYNPCKPFSEGSCTNVAVCQTDSTGKQMDYGTQESAQFDVEEFDNGKSLTVTYTSADGTASSKVYLSCSHESLPTPFIVIGNTPGTTPPTTLMGLISAECCAHTPVGPIPSHSNGDLSVGSIFCIVLLVVVVIYIFAGIVILKFVKKKEGCEVFPNHLFWKEMPGYVKDGILLTFCCCKKEE